MPLRTLRLITGAVFAAILFLLACQLPGRLAQSIKRAESSPAPTASQAAATTKTTPQAGYPSATPVIVTADTTTIASADR